MALDLFSTGREVEWRNRLICADLLNDVPAPIQGDFMLRPDGGLADRIGVWSSWCRVAHRGFMR